MQEQNSVLTCTNLCQSFQSQSIETVKQKQINTMVQNQQHLELINQQLQITIQRYSKDLADYYVQNENLMKQKQDLEEQNEALKKQIFNKNCQSKSTQTDLISKQIETQTQFRDFQLDLDFQQKQNQFSRTPKNSERFDENQNKKRKTWRECEKYQHSSFCSQKSNQQMSPKSIDCEYFESKKHLEKMLMKLTQKIQFLSDTISESQRDFQQQSIILCLQEIQAIVDYLKILINDQMVEIKKFADQVNKQVLEIIEEANKLQTISSKKQNKDDSFKFITYTEFTQNSNLDQHFNNEESNLNKSSEYLVDPNCTIINTSRNTENLLQESELYNNQAEFVNNEDFGRNLKYNNFKENTSNDQIQLNPYQEQLQDFHVEKKIEESESNKNHKINFVQDLNLQENAIIQQEDKQRQIPFDCDSDSKLNEKNQSSQIFNSQNKLNQTGSFLEANLNESNDQISQYENLLETLGDEEFDLEQINIKQNTVYNQYRKRPDNKSKAQIFNKILTFSFGNPPTSSMCMNNNNNLIPIQKQSCVENIEENEDHLNLIKQQELNIEIQNKLQNTQKSYLNFINKLLSIIGDQNTQTTIEQYLNSDAQQQEELERETLECQQKIILVVQKLSQFKQDIDSIHRQTICQSQSSVECITESTLEEIGQSFYADQIQKQFMTKIQMICNQRIENIRKVKFNVESMKKVFRSNDGEICKQYYFYGIAAADFIYLKQYISELYNFMNQINQKTIESIKLEFIERCLSDIDQLKVPSEFKILIEFLKQSIILKITIKSYY
ncbi:hypothetical protein ABPG74_011967 [Tetrahymena malaccensis]